MFKKTAAGFIGLLYTLVSFAQHNTEEINSEKLDTTSLLHAFHHGKVTGHFRYFFMGTQNAGNLTDYFANAAGGGLKYESAPFHKFQIGIGGFYIFNIGSSDLGRRDPQTRQMNRYEIGLFDLEDPYNKSDIDRLEELYVKYKTGNTAVIFGKQLINTPFINPQDSRMRPTEVEGVMGDGKISESLSWHAGWLYNLSPRSTVQWYSVAHSIGINTQGKNADGSESEYKENLSSKGILLAGASYNIKKGLKVTLWNQFVENIFNTSFMQIEVEKKVDDIRYFSALQYTRQDAVNNGGNDEPQKTYFDKNNKVNVFGIRAGAEANEWIASLNYTRITKSGRYTMPREWGQEPFFTYLSRERNEGFGDVDAIALKLNKDFLHKQLKLEVAYGQYYLPKADNYRLNKYGLPSYSHFRFKSDYAFRNFLEGFDLIFLFVYKDQLGHESLPPKYIFNRANMLNANLIINYHF
jgi:hypothetical protein